MAIIKQPPFRNVGAGLTAVLPLLDLGGTFKSITFKLGGTFTKAQIDEVRIRYQGVLIWQFTGSEMDTLNQSRLLTADANYLTMHFANPRARTITGEMIGAIDTSNATKFSVEVDINGAAVTPTLECWANIVAPKDDNDLHKRTIRAMLRNTHAPAAAGKFNLPVALGSIGGALLAGAHFFHTNITDIDVRKGSTYLQDQGEIALIQFMQDELNRSAQAGLYSFDPVFSDNQSDAIATLREPGKLANFTFDVTVSAADVIEVLAELYTEVERI